MFLTRCTKPFKSNIMHLIILDLRLTHYIIFSSCLQIISQYSSDGLILLWFYKIRITVNDHMMIKLTTSIIIKFILNTYSTNW